MSSFCELCGNPIQGLKTVIIDGSLFNVCLSCFKRGKAYQPPTAKKQVLKQTHDTTSFKKPSMFRSNKIDIFDESVLKPEFAKIIHQARMKKGYTQEYVANKINEKVILFKKIESGGIKPDELLCKKIERFLGIQLYQRLVEEDDEDET